MKYIDRNRWIILFAPIILIGGLMFAFHRNAADAFDTSLNPKPGEGNEYTYTITTVMKVLKPCNPKVMNDAYQDVRVLDQDQDSYTLEVTYYPLNDSVRKDREKRYALSSADNPKDYLKPTTTCNWDAQMRTDLTSDLKKDGIDPKHLSDTQLVQQVSKWAINRSAFVSSDPLMPICWYVDFPGGKARVYPSLRSQFDAEKPDRSWTDQRMMERQVFGKSMYYQKAHGACTSSAIYLATIFRALGIPARILYFIPPCDVNDPKQVAMLTSAIEHHGIHLSVTNGLDDTYGFADHMYNEVFIDGRWVRLNYSTLNQNIVDQNYFGLLTHIDTCRDIEETNLAATWGVRSAQWPHVAQPLTSVNPYMLIKAWDHFGKYAHIDNPQPPELTKVTVNKVCWRGTGPFKKMLSDSNLSTLPKDQTPDMMIGIAEWLPGQDYHQLRSYFSKTGHQFVLHTVGHPDIHVTLTGHNCNDPRAGWQSFGAQIDGSDRSEMVSNVNYTIEPVNTSPIYKWTIASEVMVRKP